MCVCVCEQTVLSKIPFSDLCNMQCHVTAGDAGAELLDDEALYNLTADFSVEYEVPTCAETVEE